MEKKTKTIKIGSLKIGGGNPISVQSMTKTDTSDVSATVKQIKELEAAGCQIVRCAVKNEEDALAISKIKKQISIPLVADIHFNYKLAVIAVNEGADKIRINPGNIGGGEKIKAVVDVCKEAKIPIRVGVNSGSLEKDLLKKYKHPTAEALVESALRNVKILEKLNFKDIVISIKATSVITTIKAYRLLSKKTNYPLHVGITESGIPKTGIIRSSVGIGAILADGIGDTIRVSLTPLKVAIMGCEVNGPGEAADADVGLAGGNGIGIIFRSGEVVRRVPEDEMIDALIDEIESFSLK